MKLFLTVLFVAASLLPSAFALKYDDIVGAWRGTIIEEVPNGKSYTLHPIIKIGPLGRGGIIIGKKIVNSYGNVFIEIARLSHGGKSSQVTTADGHVYCRGPGKWITGRNILRMRASLTYYEGTVATQATTFTFHGDRLTFRNTNSLGLLQTGTFTR